MIQRTRVVLYEESIDWLQFGVIVLLGVLTYAVACFFIRRSAPVVEGVEREYPPPNPDVAAFGAVAISDAITRFVTLRLTTFIFSSVYGGFIPLDQALFISAFALLLFLACSFIIVTFISKAMLPTTFRQAAFISAIKVGLQLVLSGLFFLLLIVYALLQGQR